MRHCLVTNMSVNSSFDWSPGKANVQKTKRFRYSALEERKMLHFFANELRGGNLKAKFGPAIWDNYIKAFNKHTTRTSSGLESHFRKIMVPNLPKYYAELQKEDFFLLLRFFKVGLSVEQKRMLRKFLLCRLETDQDGCFLSACSEEPGDTSIYPTREDRSKISILSTQDDVSDPDENSIENESFVEDQNQSNVENDVEEEDFFNEVVVLKTNLASNKVGETVNNKTIQREKDVVVSKRTKTVPKRRSLGIQCSDALKRKSLGIQCGTAQDTSPPSPPPGPLTRSQAKQGVNFVKQTVKRKVVNTTEVANLPIVATITEKKQNTWLEKKRAVPQIAASSEVHDAERVPPGVTQFVVSVSPNKTKATVGMSPNRTQDAVRLTRSDAQVAVVGMPLIENQVVVRVPYTSFSSSSTSTSSNGVISREARLRNLKRKLMQSLVNVLEGSESVDCFLDSVPLDRRHLFEQPKEQLEWIICDHDSSPSKREKTH